MVDLNDPAQLREALRVHAAMLHQSAKAMMDAAELELSPAEMRELDAILARIPIEGDRYPEALERMTGI